MIVSQPSCLEFDVRRCESEFEISDLGATVGIGETRISVRVLFSWVLRLELSDVDAACVRMDATSRVGSLIRAKVGQGCALKQKVLQVLH